MSILAISRLFGRSPFAPLQAHMEKVGHCVEQLETIFSALTKGDQKELEEIAVTISKLEHAADLTKNDIRNHLPKSLFLPVDRGSLLEILSLQDNLADQAEDIAVLLTFRSLKMLPDLEQPFAIFLKANLETFQLVRLVVKELHDLLESSFGGSEAEKVRDMVSQVAVKEHEVDLLQRELLKKLYSHDELPAPIMILWLRIFEGVAQISNIAEKLGNRIRMTLDLK